MRLTSKLLRSKGACEPQINLFKKLGGDTKEITEALCVEHAAEFHWDWAAERLLSFQGCQKYQRVKDTAWEEYKRGRDEAWEECSRVRNATWMEYGLERHLAWAKYERVQARTFWRIWTAENN